MKDKIALIKRLQAKAHPLPWGFSGNIPFSVSMNKPRESLSKHDDKSQAIWHYDDGAYAAAAINLMPELLTYIEELEAKLEQK